MFNWICAITYNDISCDFNKRNLTLQRPVSLRSFHFSDIPCHFKKRENTLNELYFNKKQKNTQKRRK